ncbi:hypothetical protein M0R88_00960 [Halorussus gelatinilyticus]|uniref:Uncharacterized protein n=1 Tax=Halorussus gelatinilyticus TaxID=2937524 RepID=A0A8U0IIR7_9EURY|nr:hypothetical protein [Halorussus gelatinilyticus]UPW00688.1 hypothetical protein M0R88_00960 [Halorussus gelatinilyticus]
MSPRRCPDCDLPLEEVQYDTNAGRNKIRLNYRDGGILSKLGVTSNTYAYAYVCPECGLVRFYAE